MQFLSVGALGYIDLDSRHLQKNKFNDYDLRARAAVSDGYASVGACMHLRPDLLRNTLSYAIQPFHQLLHTTSHATLTSQLSLGHIRIVSCRSP